VTTPFDRPDDRTDDRTDDQTVDRPHLLDRIEQMITLLVQRAPVTDTAVVDELVESLRRVGSPRAR
jgi:hypothetical protein